MKSLTPLSPEDDLDQRLADIASGESFITKIERKNKEKPKVDDLSFEAELQKNWWMYVLLLLSAIFTGTLGGFMGLAPYPTEEGIFFQTDGMHILLAFAYVIAFIGVTEFAFGLGKWLYFVREQNNAKQSIAMVIWMVVAGISILLTGWAGGSVIASFIDFLTIFANVNTLSQEWVVKAIPTLFFFYAILGTVYILSSRENAAKRMVKEQKREADLAHQTRLMVTAQWGKEQVMKAEIKKYMDAVERGVLSAQEAQDGIGSRKSLRQLEEDLRRDLDGDHIIGVPAHRGNGNRPQHAMAYDTHSPEDLEDLDPQRPS